jgi:PAS domain S-box-containing protein
MRGMTATARSTEELEAELAGLRKRLAELERNRELLNAIANHAPSFICILDAEGRVRDRATNLAFENALGYGTDEVGGAVFWERYVPPEDADEVRATIEDVVAGGTPRERDGRWLTKAGDVVHVAWSCTALPDIEGGRLFLVSGTDIGERTRQSEELRRSRVRIVTAADEARKRLERDLHDGPQQHLIAVRLSLQAIRKQTADPRVSEAIEHAIVELDDTVRELRELGRGIHPAALGRGLALAVGQLARRSSVAVTLHVPERRFDPNVEAAAYYVVSEALANAGKHAQAHNVTVEVSEEDGRLRVDVTDDGVGGADPAGGSGLRGLADRVSALDGTFAVESPAGGGTRVRAEMPLR